MDTTQTPVLGLDIGTETVTAGIAHGSESHPLAVSVRGKKTARYRSEVVVDDTNTVRRPDFRGPITQRVGRISRFLGQRPQLIAGAPYGVNTLMEMVAAPAVDAAVRLDNPPRALAAVVPNHWPDYIVEYYRDALTRTGLPVTTVTHSEAIAAYAESVREDGAVTCIDFGNNQASVTLAVPEGKHLAGAISLSDPKAGQLSIDAELVSLIVSHMDRGFTPDKQWLAASTMKGRAIRRASHKASSANDLIAAGLPEPFGKVKVPAGQVSDLVEDLVRRRLRVMCNDPELQEQWGIDQENGIPRKLLVAGGFSVDRSVGTAIRTEVGPWKAMRVPETIVAEGAALWVSQGRG